MQVPVSPMPHPALSDIVLAIALAAQAFFQHRGGKRRTQDIGSTVAAAVETQLTTFRLEQKNQLDNFYSGLAAEINDVRAIVVGPDGRNGLRSEIRALEKDVVLNEERRHKMRGDFDGALKSVEKEQVEISTRVGRVEQDVAGVLDRERARPAAYDRRSAS